MEQLPRLRGIDVFADRPFLQREVVAAGVYVVGQPAAYGRAVEQSKVDIERARTLLVF